MRKEVIIWSYFSLPTDLAGEMRDWLEFVEGEAYSVDLKSSVSGETVTVRLVDGWDDAYVLVNSDDGGELFDRVVGRVVFALSAHTDYLQIRTSNRVVPEEPKFRSTIK
jgi:hypothetical protein